MCHSSRLYLQNETNSLREKGDAQGLDKFSGGPSNRLLRSGSAESKWEARLAASQFSHELLFLSGLAVDLGFEGFLAANIHLDLLGLGFRLLGEFDLQQALFIVRAHLPRIY
jgi:hypothetical protein